MNERHRAYLNAGKGFEHIPDETKQVLENLIVIAYEPLPEMEIDSLMEAIIRTASKIATLDFPEGPPQGLLKDAYAIVLTDALFRHGFAGLVNTLCSWGLARYSCIPEGLFPNPFIR